MNITKDISLYIDDMRILKNIYNEFMIYNNRINTTEQNPNKLLSLILYKNLFPRDFSDLQLNKGFVYTLFAKKDEFIENEIKSIDIEIKSLQEKIDSANNEHLSKQEELDILYNKMNNYNSSSSIYINLKKEKEKREEAIENKSVERMDFLKQQIVLLKNKKILTNNKKLSQIINRQNIKDIFGILHVNEIGEETDFKEIKTSDYFDLIKFLIRNGYIDETYADYMTYFYENSLSRIDKTFLRSISDKKAKEYTYELKNPQMVIDRLSLVDFDELEVLNFDLLCHLLINPYNKEKLYRFIQQLKESKNYKFINGFLYIGKQQESFVKNINIQWTTFFYEILKDSNFSESQKKIYSILTLYYSDEKDISNINIENCLTNYIINDSKYLNIENPNIDKLINGFKLINLYFETIEYEIANKELFRAVYENSLYKLTFENIKLMLEKFYNLEDNQDFYHKNYSIISSSPETSLSQYINKFINEYMNIMIFNCGDIIIDDPIIVLSVLNNDDIKDDYKYSYINVLSTSIEFLKDVNNKKLWNLLLKKGLVEYSEENILEYYFNNGKKLDSTLIEFINRQEKELDLSNLITNYGENATSDFFNAIVKCNDLNNSRYAYIIKSLNRCYKSIPPEDILHDKMNILIDLKVIRMSLESLFFMRENYSSNMIRFIEKNFDSYVNEIISEDNFDFNEMLKILSLDVSDDNKVKLIKFTNESISIINSNYSDIVQKCILQNNFDINDIEELIITYPQKSDMLKIEIELLAIKHKNMIFQKSFMLSIELFDKLLLSTQLKEDDKIEFLIIILSNLDENQAKKYLELLRLDDYLKLFNRGRPIFKINSINKRILNIFINKNWISKYEVDKENSNNYRAYGRKNRSELSRELVKNKK